MIDVYVDGNWNTFLDSSAKHVTVFDKGKHYQMDEGVYGNFIDELEEKGYDCYFCPQLFSHPEWNGIIKYE